MANIPQMLVPIRFIEDVTVRRANEDGSSRFETFKKGQVVRVKLASANYRIGQGVAVQVKDGEEHKPVPVQASAPVLTEEISELESTLLGIRQTSAFLKTLKVPQAKEAFKQVTIVGFDEICEVIDFKEDTRLVMSAAIEDFEDTGEFNNLKELGDALDEICIKLA